MGVTVLGEHGNHDIEHHKGLGLISSSDLNQHVPGLTGLNLGMVAIDDRGKGEDHSVLVVEHWVHW